MQQIRGHIVRQCWLVWLLSVAAAAVTVYFGLGQEYLDETLLQLGVVFAFYALATGSIAGRTRDVSTVILVVWGGTFGFWATYWLGWTTQFLNIAAIRGYIPGDLPGALRVPVAIATAGAATMGVAYLATGSGRIAGYVFGSSLLAAIGPLVPVETHAAAAAGVVLWHAVVCGAMCGWAVETRVGRWSAQCQRCGRELEGLASSVCPSCGVMLSSPAGRGAALDPSRPVF